jgi:glycosyltransferase involved in cell wall biosynthesis
MAIENFHDRVIAERDLGIRTQLGLKDDDILVASPNTVYRASDFVKILSALSLLPPRFHVVTIGDFKPGALRDEIFDFAQHLNIRGRFHHIPAVQPDQYCRLLSGCNFGIVHLDATIRNCRVSFHNRYCDLLAAGLPFVYSDNESVDRICAPFGFALRYDWTSAEAMCLAIERMAQDEPQARQALARVQYRFVWSVHQDKLARFFAGANRISFLGFKALSKNHRTLMLISELTKLGKTMAVLTRGTDPPPNIPGTTWINL